MCHAPTHQAPSDPESLLLTGRARGRAFLIAARRTVLLSAARSAEERRGVEWRGEKGEESASFISSIINTTVPGRTVQRGFYFSHSSQDTHLHDTPSRLYSIIYTFGPIVEFR